MPIENIDLSNEDTSMPVLKAGLHEFTISKIEYAQNKAKTGEYLKLTLKLARPAETTEGKQVNVGYPLFHNISLVDTENYSWKRNVAQLQEAVLEEKGVFNTEDLVGKNVWANVSVQTSAEYGTQNRIGRFVKPSNS